MFGSKLKIGFTCGLILVGLFLGLASCSSREARMDEAFNPTLGLKYKAIKPDVLETFNLKVVFFDTDSEHIRADQVEIIKWNADWLRRNPTARVQLEGHCDRRGTELYNYELGDRRANAIKSFMVKLGIEGSRIDAVSYGRRPGDEKFWGKNRRVTFEVVFPEDAPPESKELAKEAE